MEEYMEVEQVFVTYEIDLDYEFDAARFFDFCRQETDAEALEAEHWFETASTYPPSPFVTKLLVGEDIFPLNVNVSPKAKDLENTTPLNTGKSEVPLLNDEAYEYAGFSANLGNGVMLNHTEQSQLVAGFSFHMKGEESNAKSKHSIKQSLPRGSTLMKPTASQLAKQNYTCSSRFQKVLTHNKEKSPSNPSGVESQAPKRQKLEGGFFLHKVIDAKPQTNFIHKVPKKENTDKTPGQAKLKLTIPREPELETAHRAQRTRPKKATEPGHVPVTAHSFKARPLNRKILNAPTLQLPKKSTPRLPEFQEFHLKTLERALQHNSATSSTLYCKDSDKGLDKHNDLSAKQDGIKESRRPSSKVAPEQTALDSVHYFKARPLNKKIFCSKGEIGVFRNCKRQTTVPMEFNLRTERRLDHDLPIELFSKLSLTSELQSNYGTKSKLQQQYSTSIKGSKENVLNTSHPEQETTYTVKKKFTLFGGKRSQYCNEGCISEASTEPTMRRIFGIR